MTHILGLSAYYHDSAAAVLRDGLIVAAAQEERFTRKKHDARFPAHAARYCLAEAGIGLADVQQVVFYDKPLLKFERLLETYLAHAPRGFRSFVTAMPVWLKEKLYLKRELRLQLQALAATPTAALPPLLFTEHHQAHAASAFFPSRFERAAVLCLDGVGEWSTSSAWLGQGATLTPLWQIDFPHSLGLLYSAFTYYLGFKVNSGEYKVMGLAPYGQPTYVQTILDHLIDVKADGSFRLHLRYFDFATGLRMTNQHFAALFGLPVRGPEARLTQAHMDIARSLQEVTELIVLRLGRALHAETGASQLCMAGGVALNCVANGRLLREGPFQDIFVQPAAGDAGGALGAAYAAWHQYLEQPRHLPPGRDAMQGALLGPRHGDAEIEQMLRAAGGHYRRLEDDELLEHVAAALAQGQVVGWFQGRMEFGPRALGARSILGDARSPRMQAQMNLKIKYRESFRPFAPAVLAERVGDCFEDLTLSPYMLMVAPVKQALRLPMTPEQQQLFGIDKLNIARSSLPAITHVDYSARVQTVHADTHPRFHALLRAFERHTGCPVLVNTSFNVRGEPIVGAPLDAWRCFMRTEIDTLVLENFVLAKTDQTPLPKDQAWQQEFELD